MKIVATLGGTDAGRSGLGTYAREVLPRLARKSRGGLLYVTGTAKEHEAYPELDGLVERVVIGAAMDRPALSAAWHALRLGPLAARLGAEVILLPAANRRVCLTSSVPAVAVVHDLAMLRVRGKYDALRTTYARSLVVSGLRRARGLVAISQSTADEIVRFTGRPATDVTLVSNGVDTVRFSPAADTDGEGRAAASRRRYILYASRLEHPGKNHVGLLRAFARSTVSSTHELVFCGEDWGGGERIVAEIQALGLGDRVRLLGRVGDDELVTLFRGAEAVTMVGFGEGFGLPALEALACGVPVLAARAGALPEVVGDAAVLCDPHDTADMAAGLDRVTSPEARRMARVAGPARARRFDWEETAAQLLAACNAVMGTTVLTTRDTRHLAPRSGASTRAIQL